MAAAIGLLIAPSLQHRIVEGGEASGRILRVTTRFADWALLPFAVGFGADIAIVVSYRFGFTLGGWIGAGTTVLAFALWYAAEWLLLARRGTKESVMEATENTPLDERVDQLLTEARVLIPGGQALLGFQLAIMLTDGFARLPASSQTIHLLALCSITIAVMLLMAPAAFHRISYRGRDTEEFHTLGSALVIAGAAVLALGIAGDLYVAITLGVRSAIVGALCGLAAGVALFVTWFAIPLALRRRRERQAV
jgi:hypothetical protein